LQLDSASKQGNRRTSLFDFFRPSAGSASEPRISSTSKPRNEEYTQVMNDIMQQYFKAYAHDAKDKTLMDISSIPLFKENYDEINA
jgi:hypothetical protein